MREGEKKIAVVVGAGPAGLTAASELIDRTDVHPLLFEATSEVGGISRTEGYRGNRMDIGGHRFFSKSDRIMQWWPNVMPMQSAPSLDEILTSTQSDGTGCTAHNPECDDRVMLLRRRVSRIFFLRKFFDYPISVKYSTFANLGLWRTVKSGAAYLVAQLFKRKEKTLEDFYVNRFGSTLYRLFFEDYTRKVWGKHPSQLGAEWGSQRVKVLSAVTLLKNALLRPFRKSGVAQKDVETSLIENFIYPKYGPGQLWTLVADRIVRSGGNIFMQQKVVAVNVEKGRVVSVDVCDAQGNVKNVACDYLLSTMPLKELVAALRGIDVPQEIRKTAEGLPYRDFITVGLLLDSMKIKNETKLRTYADRLPDTWIYVQERDVKVGRIQIFNNWSPYMVADYKNRMFIGLEYFCSEGDSLWQMESADFVAMATDELVSMGLIERGAVLDATMVKMPKAYPAYYGTYGNLHKVRGFLDGIENLYCIGRNGQHRYNNMDHSMMTAMVAVENIAGGVADKSAVWNVNTDSSYHESR